MVSDPTESRLIRGAVQGDAEAFGDLYQQHLDAIYRYTYYRVGSHEEAEDLTEQVFLKAWESVPGYREEKTPFRAWLYRIAHNTVIDHYRRHKESLPLDDHHSVADGEPDLEARLVSLEQSERLARAMARLKPIHQHVLVLRFIEGLGARQVGSILSQSAGAVRVLQHRALKEMYGLLAVEEVTGG
jgi:RNA polymerase sigma-70 factor (ECF subfamily)